jgi:hypothetical protein
MLMDPHGKIDSGRNAFRIQRPGPRELTRCLAIQCAADENPALFKAKIRFVERTIRSDHLVPIAIFTERVFDGFGELDQAVAAVLEVLVTIQVDLSDDVTGVQFESAFEVSRCQPACPLSVSAPQAFNARERKQQPRHRG